MSYEEMYEDVMLGDDDDDDSSDEREDIDCPDCGEPAKYGDGGISCSNENCDNHGG